MAENEQRVAEAEVQQLQAAVEALSNELKMLQDKVAQLMNELRELEEQQRQAQNEVQQATYRYIYINILFVSS